MIGVRGLSSSASMRADAARGFQAVHARHVQIHQHAIERRAGGARGEPAFDRGAAAAGHGRAVAELDQQRADQKRVDLIVLGDQDREAAAAGAMLGVSTGSIAAP